MDIEFILNKDNIFLDEQAQRLCKRFSEAASSAGVSVSDLVDNFNSSASSTAADVESWSPNDYYERIHSQEPPYVKINRVICMDSNEPNSGDENIWNMTIHSACVDNENGIRVDDLADKIRKEDILALCTFKE